MVGAKHVKNFILRSYEKLGLADHTKNQTYQFTYRITVENHSESSADFYLVIPVPSSNSSQKLLSDVRFSPQLDFDQKDDHFQNRYIGWNVNLKPKTSQFYEESFQVEVLPSSTPISLLKSYFLDDYKEIQLPSYYQYLSNRLISSGNSQILQLAEQLKGKEENLFIILKRIYHYIISTLSYKNPISGLYSAIDAFEKKEVDCGGFSSLFAALCLALGIPARVVCGFWSDYEKGLVYGTILMHAWVECMLPSGQWISFDPSTEQLFLQRRSNKSGRFGFVGSDRIIFSYGADIPIQIDGQKLMVDILQNPLVYPKLDSRDMEMKLECITRRVK